MTKETKKPIENDFSPSFKKTLIKGERLISIRQSAFLIGVLGILVFLVVSAISVSKQGSYINTLYAQTSPYSDNYPGNGWGGSCCGSPQVNPGTTDGSLSSGSCCGGSGGGLLSQKNIEKIKEEALRYYQQKYGGQADSAEVTDYGCHIQIDLYKEGKLTKSFSYRNGQLAEL